MSSVEDVYASASGAESVLGEAQQQVTTASQKAGEGAMELAATKELAEQLAEASGALGLEAKADEAEAIRAELEGLTSKVGASAERLNTEAGELVAAKQVLDELLARIQALAG